MWLFNPGELISNLQGPKEGLEGLTPQTHPACVYRPPLVVQAAKCPSILWWVGIAVIPVRVSAAVVSSCVFRRPSWSSCNCYAETQRVVAVCACARAHPALVALVQFLARQKSDPRGNSSLTH